MLLLRKESKTEQETQLDTLLHMNKKAFPPVSGFLVRANKQSQQNSIIYFIQTKTLRLKLVLTTDLISNKKTKSKGVKSD